MVLQRNIITEIRPIARGIADQVGLRSENKKRRTDDGNHWYWKNTNKPHNMTWFHYFCRPKYVLNSTVQMWQKHFLVNKYTYFGHFFELGYSQYRVLNLESDVTQAGNIIIYGPVNIEYRGNIVAYWRPRDMVLANGICE
jgi:glucan biosynthesis protein